MTTLRQAAEQALEALDEADLLMEHRQNIELRRSALVALRAALEQPDIEIPASVPEGWKLVPVEPTDDMLYDIQEYSHILPPRGRRIWAHMLAAAPQPPALEQPQVEQEPVAWANINKQGDITHTSNKKMAWAKTPIYTHPQPAQQPLTEEQIKTAFLNVDLFEEGDELLGYEVDITRAIEAMHGIGGEK